jgi:glutathione S-transferase
MQLIGMLDSPYVRRTAIALSLLGVQFDHKAVSVFSTFEQFQRINPVVKAPTLICDDGEVLMDSTLILEYAEWLAGPQKSLLPSTSKERQHALSLIGLALAACEKAVQIVYERNLRPVEKQHEPWVVRVRGQLLAAVSALEKEFTTQTSPLAAIAITQAGLTAAVLWRFVQMMLPETVVAADYPSLRSLSVAAEKLPAFIAFPPDGPGVAPT